MATGNASSPRMRLPKLKLSHVAPAYRRQLQKAKTERGSGDNETERLIWLFRNSIKGESMEQEASEHLSGIITERYRRQKSERSTKRGDRGLEVGMGRAENAAVEPVPPPLPQDRKQQPVVKKPVRQRFRYDPKSVDDLDRDWRTHASAEEELLQEQLKGLFRQIRRINNDLAHLKFGEMGSHDDIIERNKAEVGALSPRTKRWKMHELQMIHKERLARAKKLVKVVNNRKQQHRNHAMRSDRREERQQFEIYELEQQQLQQTQRIWMELLSLASSVAFLSRAIAKKRMEENFQKFYILCVIRVQRWFKRRSGLTFDYKEWNVIRWMKAIDFINKWRNRHKKKMLRRKVALKRIICFVQDYNTIAMQFMRVSHAVRSRIVKAQRMARHYMLAWKVWRRDIDMQWEAMQRLEYQRYRMGMTEEVNEDGAAQTNDKQLGQRAVSVSGRASLTPGKAALFAVRAGLRGIEAASVINLDEDEKSEEAKKREEEEKKEMDRKRLLEALPEDRNETRIASAPRPGLHAEVLQGVRTRRTADTVISIRRAHVALVSKTRTEWKAYRKMIFDYVDKAKKSSKTRGDQSMETISHIDRLTTLYPMPKNVDPFSVKLTDDQMTQLVRKGHVEAKRLLALYEAGFIKDPVAEAYGDRWGNQTRGESEAQGETAS